MDPTVNPAFIIFVSLSPLLIAFVKQSGWSRQTNALIALVSYVVVGIAGVILSGEPLTLENAVNVIAVTTVIGRAAYGLIWSNIGADDEGNGGLEDRLTEVTSVVR